MGGVQHVVPGFEGAGGFSYNFPKITTLEIRIRGQTAADDYHRLNTANIGHPKRNKMVIIFLRAGVLPPVPSS